MADNNTTIENERRISVGECLDQLLNRDCRFPFDRHDDPSKEDADIKFGGLVCPSMDGSRPGTGNIVIKGSAGTGKSTLALQIAVEAARRNEDVCTAYISLEESPQQILTKAVMFGWQHWLTPLTIRTDDSADQEQSREELKKSLAQVLSGKSFKCPNFSDEKEDNDHQRTDCPTKSDPLIRCEYSYFRSKDMQDCPFKEKDRDACGGEGCSIRFDNHVLLPSLEARVFEPSDSYEKHDKLFKIRMDQLEDLLRAACKLNEEAEEAKDSKQKRLEIVCLDSLNVFGQGHLTRDHLSALFDLFRRYRVIGVFVYEQLEHDHLSGKFDHSLKDIEFLADTVIDLTGGEHQGYWVRHLHISKSRHQHQVPGRHPFKIMEDKRKQDEKMCPHLITTQAGLPSANKEIRISRFGIRIFPSIHVVIQAARQPKDISTVPGAMTGNASPKTFFQDRHLNKIGGPALVKQEPAVATVYGPAVAGKSVLAFNFLLQGLIENKNGLLITLGESCTFNSGSAALGLYDCKKLGAIGNPNDYILTDILNIPTDKLRNETEKNACRILRYAGENHKVTFAVWRCDLKSDVANATPEETASRLSNDNYIIEMALKPGTLLLEELIAIVRHVYAALTQTVSGVRDSGSWPKRAVLQNVNRTGFAYPFLREPTTGPELFLPGLTHLFHCRGTDLLITAQTGGVSSADDITKQAISLADAALECNHLDVFGDRYITITGPGLVENDSHTTNSPEGAPGVLKLERNAGSSICLLKINMDILSDLVGFSTGDIRRPGVLLQLFEEGGLHKKYNQHVKRLVQFAMGDPLRNGHKVRQGIDTDLVQIDTFDSHEAGAFHKSLSLLSGAPLEKTVIRTIDEFAYRDHIENRSDDIEKAVLLKQKKASGRYENVYYRNMLLFLCDNKTYDDLHPLTVELENERFCLQLLAGFHALIELGYKKPRDCDIMIDSNTLGHLDNPFLIIEMKNRLEEMKSLLEECSSTTNEALSSIDECLSKPSPRDGAAESHPNNEPGEGMSSTEDKPEANRKGVGQVSLDSFPGTKGRSLPVDDIREFRERIRELKSLVISLSHLTKLCLGAIEDMLSGEGKKKDQDEGKKKDQGNYIRFANKFIEVLKNLGRSKEYEEQRRREYRKYTLVFWEKIKDLASSQISPATFLYDQRARETLASLALDCIIALSGCHRGGWDLTKSVHNNHIVSALTEDLSLRKLLKHLDGALGRAVPLLQDAGQRYMKNFPDSSRGIPDNIDTGNTQKEELTGEARDVFSKSKPFILLAWYSHIREMIDLVCKDTGAVPEGNINKFVKNLKVLPLPAGGVKGDWYLQVPKGSVSISLGWKIRETLLDPVEDFDRFVAGVGLPCWPRKDSEFKKYKTSEEGDLETEFSEKRFNRLKIFSDMNYPELIKAWPGGDVSLQTVLWHHRFAHRRSDIRGYLEIRNALYHVMEDILLHSKERTSGVGLSTEEYEEFIINLIKQLALATNKADDARKPQA